MDSLFRIQSALMALPLAAVMSYSAFAQCPAESWVNDLATPAPDGAVWSLATLPNGDLLAGGSFQSIGGVSASRIARWDGSRWSPLGVGLNHVVYSIAVLPDGSIVAGGSFSGSGSTQVFRIAKWDGANWQPIGAIGNGYVRCMALHPSGMLYVGGNFSSADGTAASRVAAWDGTNWTSLGSGTNGEIYTIAFESNGSVLVGGVINTAGGIPGRNNVARWNGTSWDASFGGPGGPNVWDLAVMPNGDIVAAGTLGPSAYGAHAVEKWTAATNQWRSVGPDTGGGASYMLAVLPDGTLVSGHGGNSSPGISTWDGTAWNVFGSGRPLGASYCSTVSSDGELFVGGNLSTPDGSGTPQFIGHWGWPDTDKDGLRDDWEICGVPYLDSLGAERRYVLPNANPLQKDIYVEVDGMATMCPQSVGEFQPVIDAFDPSPRTVVPPMPNVAGALHNVKLHIQLDETNLTLTNNGDYREANTGGQPDYGFSDFHTDKMAFFGSATADERGPSSAPNPDWPFIREAKSKAFRYCIFARSHANSSDAGVAEGSGCDDFMVTLGRFSSSGGTAQQRAAAFMHELGHTLGLDHGGGEGDESTVQVGNPPITVKQSHIKWKPNYHSIMNYWWAMPNPSTVGQSFRFDFSDSVLPPLNEAVLREADGLVASSLNFRIPYRHVGPQRCASTFDHPYNATIQINLGIPSVSPSALQPIDWDGSCGMTGVEIAVDLNSFPELTPASTPPHPNDAYERAWNGEGLTVLRGHDDWSNLRYSFRGSPHYAAGAPPVSLGCHYTPEILDFIASLGPCDPIDFNQDSLFPDTLDIDDFLLVFAGGTCSNHPDCNDVDFNNDGLFPDTLDIDSLLSVFSGGACL